MPEATPVTEQAPSPPEPSPGPVSFYRVSPHVVDLIWEPAQKLLALGTAREYGRFGTEHIYRWLKAGSHQLFIATQDGRIIATVLTELVVNPSGKRTFSVDLAGGSQVHEWLPQAVRLMREFGRLQGATEFRVTGRKGWERLLKPYGFEFESVVLTRQEV